MSHKVNPKGFRLREVSDWASRWFVHRDPSKYLEEDFRIRSFLEKKFKDASLEKIEIERSPNKLTIFIFSSRPGLIIGRGGQQIEEVKKELQNKVFKNLKKDQALKIEIKGIKNPWLSAPLIGQWVAYRIEKRMPFRRVLKQSLSMAANYKEIKGIRVQVSGRLNGATIARTEWLQKGQMPRGTLRANIDYALTEAHCTYGVIGIKVWLYKGETFNS